jgi:hypothetical protein
VIKHSGDLIVRYAGATQDDVDIQRGFWSKNGYELEPIFKAFQRTSSYRSKKHDANWFLARRKNFIEGNPWDAAHRFAALSKYSLYAEPDLLSESLRAVEQTQGLDSDWPPPSPISPGWHLEKGFAEFYFSKCKRQWNSNRASRYWLVGTLVKAEASFDSVGLEFP